MARHTIIPVLSELFFANAVGGWALRMSFEHRHTSHNTNRIARLGAAVTIVDSDLLQNATFRLRVAEVLFIRSSSCYTCNWNPWASSGPTFFLPRNALVSQDCPKTYEQQRGR
jgi:hypothetical protein